MAEERLTVKLKADIADLDSKLDRVNKDLDELSRSMEKNDKQSDKFTKSMAAAGNAAIEMSKAAVAVGTALATMITLTAKSEQELQVLANTAKTTTSDFEALSFATKQYGVDARGTADAMNDIIERLAEFSVSDGGGAFDDFALSMGLSKNEAKALADELKELSGEDALRELVRQMEDAEVSTADMTFVMKSLSNDLEFITPLFTDQAKELDTLKKRYDAVNKSLEITQDEAKELKEAATNFDLAMSTLGNSSKVISSSLAPAFNSFINEIIDKVPEATRAISHFIESFQAGSQAQITSRLVAIDEEMKELQGEIDNTTSAWGRFKNVLTFTSTTSGSLQAKMEALKDEAEGLKNELLELSGLTPPTGPRGDDGDNGKPSGGSGSGSGESNNAELQAIIDRFKTEEELLTEKFIKEQELFAGNKEVLLQLETEYQENIKALQDEVRDDALAADQEAFEAMDKLRKDATKNAQKEARDKRKTDKEKQDSEAAYFGAAQALGDAFFEDNKAVKAGLVVTDTAAGIMKAFAELPYPAAVAASAGIAATGVAQLSSISSASKGGGGTVTTPVAAPVDSVADIEAAQNLTASAGDVSGSNQAIIIKIESDDTATAEFINGIMSTAQVSGAIS